MKLFYLFRNFITKIKKVENTDFVTIPNATTQIENLANTTVTTYEKDYVIETGTSGNWTYRKWAGGKAECWGYPSVSSAPTSSYGNLFYSGAHEFTFPSGLFVAGPTIEIVVERHVNGLYWSSIYTSNASKVSSYLASARSEGTTATSWFHIIATGRWKAIDTFGSL